MDTIKSTVQLVKEKMTLTQDSEQQSKSDDLLDDLLLDAGLGPRHVVAREEHISKTVWDRCKRFANGECFFIYGNVGTGKTYVAATLMRAYLKTGVLEDYHFYLEGGCPAVKTPKKIRFVSMVDLLAEIKATFSGGNTTEEDVVDFYSRSPCLVIDDIGVEKPTDWALQAIYTIIDRRYRYMKHTLITSNMGLQLLRDRLGERIPSRITEMCGLNNIIEIKGKDRRLQ